jgi:hypothetical protein
MSLKAASQTMMTEPRGAKMCFSQSAFIDTIMFYIVWGSIDAKRSFHIKLI